MVVPKSKTRLYLVIQTSFYYLLSAREPSKPIWQHNSRPGQNRRARSEIHPLSGPLFTHCQVHVYSQPLPQSSICLRQQDLPLHLHRFMPQDIHHRSLRFFPASLPSLRNPEYFLLENSRIHHRDAEPNG